VKSLNDVGFGSPLDLLAAHLADDKHLAPWLTNAQINRDRNLRLQYLAGMGMNRNEAVTLYQTIAAYRPSRELDETQSAAISKTLMEMQAQRISIIALAGDPEAIQYANKLREAILAGGWNVEGVQELPFANRIAGLHISVGTNPAPAAANELFRALRAASLNVVGNFDPKTDPASVSLVVGVRE
jgi:hypothetical protein